MHGINQISSIQTFAVVIILHNPASGDKSRFNRNYYATVRPHWDLRLPKRAH